MTPDTSHREVLDIFRGVQLDPELAEGMADAYVEITQDHEGSEIIRACGHRNKDEEHG